MTPTIRSANLQRALRNAYNHKLTGHISLSRWVGYNLQYSTLTFMEGQLLKANIQDHSGQRALGVIATLEFDKIEIVRAMVSPERDADLPHVATLLEDNVRASQADVKVTAVGAAPFTNALVDETINIIQQIYGDIGVRKVQEIIATLPPSSNPSLFLDRCEELLVPMFGKSRARELIRNTRSAAFSGQVG